MSAAEPTDATPRNRAWSKPALIKLLFGLLLVGLLLRQLDLHQVYAVFQRFSWSHIAIATALFAASWPIAAARWRLFAPRVRFQRLLELTLVGQFYALVLPGQIAGEAVKALRIAKGNADAESLAASVVMDRVIGTLSLLLVSWTGILLTARAMPFVLHQLFLALSAVLLISIFIFNIPSVHRWLERWILRAVAVVRQPRLVSPIQRLIVAWREFSRSPGRLLASIFLGVILQGIAIAMYMALARDIGIDVSWVDWAWIVGVTSLAMLLPVSIGGIGLREGSLIGCLAYLHIAGESAIALSFAVFAVTLCGALTGALIELKRHSRSAGQTTAK